MHVITHEQLNRNWRTHVYLNIAHFIESDKVIFFSAIFLYKLTLIELSNVVSYTIFFQR